MEGIRTSARKAWACDTCFARYNGGAGASEQITCQKLPSGKISGEMVNGRFYCSEGLYLRFKPSTRRGVRLLHHLLLVSMPFHISLHEADL